jgi:very-short-patch-repair endonuclease
MSSYNDNLHRKASPKLFEFAKALRHASTEAEGLLWQKVRNKQIENLKFRRQHPLDKYIADFYCHEKKLVIELDGSIHDVKEKKEDDFNRTYVLQEFGITVLRFRNEEVKEKMEFVLEQIKAIIKEL